MKSAISLCTLMLIVTISCMASNPIPQYPDEVAEEWIVMSLMDYGFVSRCDIRPLYKDATVYDIRITYVSGSVSQVQFLKACVRVVGNFTKKTTWKSRDLNLTKGDTQWTIKTRDCRRVSNYNEAQLTAFVLRIPYLQW